MAKILKGSAPKLQFYQDDLDVLVYNTFWIYYHWELTVFLYLVIFWSNGNSEVRMVFTWLG